MLHSFIPSIRQFNSVLLCALGLMAIWSILSPIQAVELYRCTLNGKVEFRQTACPAGEQEKTRIIDRSSGMTPSKPAVRLLKEPVKPRKNRSTQPAKSWVDEERCWKTEKRLEKVEQTLRGGYKASQYQRLHRKQAEYEEYLRLFCP
ncbi:MAG: hypothetical protein ABFR65_02750 [Pseudomonadota bacterium]